MKPSVSAHTNQLKALQILHTAMLAGMVIFGVVSAIVKLSARQFSPDTLNKVLQVTALAITFILVKTGLTIFDRKLQTIPPGANASEKLAIYRTGVIIKWTLIELPILFSIISFMLTRNYAFIALALALVIYFAFQGPNKVKLMLQLQLTNQELAQLEGKSE